MAIYNPSSVSTCECNPYSVAKCSTVFPSASLLSISLLKSLIQPKIENSISYNKKILPMCKQLNYTDCSFDVTFDIIIRCNKNLFKN